MAGQQPSADPAECHAQFIACLREIAAGDDTSALTVYDGDVADEPPVDDVEGLVLPYAAVWGSPGADPGERAVSGPRGLLWTPRVTVAAGTQRWCLQGATLVRRAVRALVLPGGGRLLEPVGYVPPPVQLDRDEDPPRYFLPLEWTALLP